MGNAVSAKWLQPAKQDKRDAIRLFCFPYAGGAAAIYRHWDKFLPDLEIVAIEFPGHSSRIQEQPLRRIEPMVDDIIGKFISMFKEKPFAFFGHSMGAIVSFEVARKLSAEHQISPACLFVSGRQAPHLPESRPPIYGLPHDELMEELRRLNGTPREVLECDELMELILPMVRADFELVQTYEYRASVKLEYPIIAFGGIHDVETPREELEAWKTHTTQNFALHMLCGDHFFLHSEEKTLLQILGQELRRHTSI